MLPLSVVIPTHNPRLDYLERVLAALRLQTLPTDQWELVLIDNASIEPLATRVSLDWHPQGSVVREERIGLTAARLRGFSISRGEVIVLVDDDNVLAPDYLALVNGLAGKHSFLGSWSGRVELEFEPGVTPPPPSWRSYLTERLCVQAVWSNDPSHNASTPWGAGLCVRSVVAKAYCDRSRENPHLLRLDLNGGNLVYGGDTDIAYFGCSRGFGKGVFPELRISHLIAPNRCQREYLLRVIEGHAYSEWLHHWVLHQELPVERSGAFEQFKRMVRFGLADSDARIAEIARVRGRRRAVRSLSPPV